MWSHQSPAGPSPVVLAATRGDSPWRTLTAGPPAGARQEGAPQSPALPTCWPAYPAVLAAWLGCRDIPAAAAGPPAAPAACPTSAPWGWDAAGSAPAHPAPAQLCHLLHLTAPQGSAPSPRPAAQPAAPTPSAPCCSLPPCWPAAPPQWMSACKDTGVGWVLSHVPASPPAYGPAPLTSAARSR